MYKQELVMAVKANGKVLREFDNSVYIPFGSEYSILLKNLSNRKVKVSVSIDGKDALDGHGLVIDAGKDLELKRFISNGNLDVGNAFKFIEKTAKISKHRGDRAEDGLITIKYEYATEFLFNNVSFQGSLRGSTSWAGKQYNTTPYVDYSHVLLSDTSDEQARGITSQVMYKSAFHQNNMQVKSVLPQKKNDNGITAPGSVTEQKFSTTYFYGDGKVHTMTLQLKGGTYEEDDFFVEVTKPVVVKKVKRCTVCGTNVRQVAKFCHQCGASVEIV